MTKRIGIFGGTFNPIHMGHLIPAQEIVIRKKLDKLIFVPNSNPPHKKNEELLNADLRYKMVELAISGTDYFGIDNIELKRPGYSYTIDTMTHYVQKYKDADLFFIIGADSLLEIHMWKDSNILLRDFSILVAKRTGFDLKPEIIESLPFEKNIIEKIKSNIVDTPFIDVSASVIRAKRKNNESIKYLVPEKVNEFIIENNLYID